MAPQWYAALDKESEREALTGERRVEWLLIRAYAAASPGEPSPLMGKKWLDEAFAVTERTEVKREIVRQMAWGYAMAMKHNDGLAYLDRMQADGVIDEKLLASQKTIIRRNQVRYLNQQAWNLRQRAKQFEAQAAAAATAGKASSQSYYLRLARQCSSRADMLSARADKVN